MIARRTLLANGIGGIAAGMLIPRVVYAAAPTERRFVFIIQRGAADGLHIVPPLGDPGYAQLRAPFLETLSNAHRVDATFSLHPALSRVAGLFDARQAMAVHATASVYRDRSHFDGQNVLETGGRHAYTETIGWMNRLVGVLPSDKGLALATDIPMALRGPAAVTSYAPTRLPASGADLMDRVGALYADDPQLAGLWHTALSTQAMVGSAVRDNGRSGEAIGRIAAQLLAPNEGARIMMIETDGWDTHSAQIGRLNTQLRNLDALVGALADGLGAAWNQTLVVVATEFGRTAALNGTGGTDHGTASALLLIGGALHDGGRVIADWPGLAPSHLYQGRDLRPTSATEAVIVGALARHFDQDADLMARTVYPDQPDLKPQMA
ncbi:DUF1501 domain-containing protein [Stakelama sp. CBK3Z-3]|uniref:DUF1501 domain-containing protein n=1 Tax=Stakelama flava TaxID=2860338 RepID=A0ABS6XQF8_9SPHN|nr:DUF1501 domain-containing protein [Stakelama flava]MBW4332346.1 DUF1501 domain-containing protein [Stakelama flava]